MLILSLILGFTSVTSQFIAIGVLTLLLLRVCCVSVATRRTRVSEARHEARHEASSEATVRQAEGKIVRNLRLYIRGWPSSQVTIISQSVASTKHLPVVRSARNSYTLAGSMEQICRV